MWICPYIILEGQCGARSSRSRTHMILLLVNIRRNASNIEQEFVDSTKAFGTLNRSALLTSLSKLGSLSQFVNFCKPFQKDMKARLNFNELISEPIAIDHRVKQGDIAAPAMLFHIFCCSYLARIPWQ